MKIILTVLVALICAGEVLAQDSSVVALTFNSSLASHPTRIVVAGVHDLATDCIDKDLAEVELPPFAPSTLSARMRLPEECNEFTDITSSYRDLREMREGQFMITYKIDVSRASGFTITVSWDQDLHWAIDSAIIYDNNKFNVPEINMRDEGSILIENSFVRELNVDIWYNFTKTSVEDDKYSTSTAMLFPNPANTSFSLDAELPFGTVLTVHNILGVELANFKITESKPVFDVSQLSAGMYVVKVQIPNSTQQSHSLQIR